MISKFEWWILTRLLKRHGNKYLDQFYQFKLKSKYGWVYVDISREPWVGEDIHYPEVK